MKALSVAYKNLKRKKIRTVLTIVGVGVAVAVLVSLFGFDAGYQRSLNNDIDKLGYHILVTAKGCPYEAATLMLKGGGGLRYMEDDVYKRILNDSRIDKIAPQLVASVYNQEGQGGRGAFALYMGIEKTYLYLKPWSEFKSGGWFSGPDSDEAIMGYEAAEVEQRLVGDQIFVPGINKVLTVKGIFQRTGTQDDGIIFIPLSTAQNIFELPGKLTGIGIKLKNIQDMAQFEEDLYNVPGIQVISLAQVRGTILNLVGSARAMANSIALIAIFIAIISVTNTILMSVFERTREIGVMKALGASAADIFKIIWMETILICIFGGIFGVAVAMFGSSAVEYIIRQTLPYAPTGKLVLIKPALLALSFLATVVMGLIAGTYPALRASLMKPVEAIRSGE
ncbi:MAG: ABC transporter permease [Candidatus Omnitrophica bacterium]|nr:ABC transporter permease [Candidatus Omnitrophota bacterium]MBU4346318.1 ABC transporter permease [Candidatus Omnitrophota bacterium]MBU4473218.1 ABC transporter permease [Candidatus Omnitrophota bacterium]MCG2706581.1 ABC transporter permease [Candidatus Omnitrophota bacterium]